MEKEGEEKKEEGVKMRGDSLVSLFLLFVVEFPILCPIFCCVVFLRWKASGRKWDNQS